MTHETPLLIHGVPAAEFVSESDRSMSIARVVIIKNGIIKVDVHGDKGVSISPLVRRFFDSFKLLPAN